MTLEIGTYGEELTLKIRQGATFGPFYLVMQNPDGSAVDLTGRTIRGQIRKKASDTDIVATLNVTITDAVHGTYQFGLSAAVTTGLECGDSIYSSDSRYVHDIEMADVAGNVTPLYYDTVYVFREVTK